MTLDKVHVAISNLQVWKAWTPHVALETFPDLYAGLDFEDFEQVTSAHAIHALTKARAQGEAPQEFLAYQKAIDEDVGDVLLQAAERVDALLRDPTHFLKNKDETVVAGRAPLVQQKKEMIAALLSKPDLHGHQWEAHRSGAQCGLCRTKVHTKSLLQELKQATQAPCTVQAPELRTKPPRMSVIHDLIQAQTTRSKGFTTCGWRRHTSGAHNAAPTSWREPTRKPLSASSVRPVGMAHFRQRCGMDTAAM